MADWDKQPPQFMWCLLQSYHRYEAIHWTLHPTVISELFWPCLHCVDSSGGAQVPSEGYCPIHPPFPLLCWQGSRWPTAGAEVPHGDELLPGPPSTDNSESSRVKCKFTPFITVNHMLTSTWGCSHSCYKAGLRLRFGVLFHAQDISERDRFCTVTTDPSDHCTTLMQNDTCTSTCYLLFSTIELDLHSQKHSISCTFISYVQKQLYWFCMDWLLVVGDYRGGFYEKLAEASNMSSTANP